jgi:hypothetical protein
MLKLKQIPEELEEKIQSGRYDEHLDMLGFHCHGQLLDYSGFEEFFERLWVWSKTEDDAIYIIVTADAGNTNYALVYTDMYVPDIIEEINRKKHSTPNPSSAKETQKCPV